MTEGSSHEQGHLDAYIDFLRSNPRIDVWMPEGARFPTIAPEFLCDDGNQLFALMHGPAADVLADDQKGKKFVTELRAMANFIRQAASDAGVHRLLVVLLVASEKRLAEVFKLVFNPSVTRGQFKLVVLPSSKSADEVKRQLQFLGPLEFESVFNRSQEADLIDHLRPALELEESEQAEPKSSLCKDLESYLSGKTGGDDDPWPSTRECLDQAISRLSEGKGQVI